ncbi:hypothetical protein K488DRAFT_88809 [Vararia minispora EC-137]|uniref:Uncharacterized protein n=1 Tax=Vararia minispora EC-137 TaxID=1314806 RepID=A0ACB8QCC9_9AGAM|nr:hypothetical protein K488DRAFT_88809 [Vararia minispora EC-137]
MSQPSPSQPSKRWTHFHTALHLATQRAAHKWTAEDFAECFPLWNEEEPNGVAGTHRTVSEFVESYITKSCEQLLKEEDAQARIDALDAVVVDARTRKRAGAPVPPDVWRADLAPRQAARARTVPVLEQERNRLKAYLAQLEEENVRAMDAVAERKRRQAEAESQVTAVLAQNEEIYDKWEQLPMEEMQSWTLQLVESLSTAKPMPP